MTRDDSAAMAVNEHQRPPSPPPSAAAEGEAVARAVPTGSAAFVAAMFLGAFLLFLVQPMAGKYVLPWFGGGPAVWTTCMLFFQAVLLAGYSYAHLGVSRLRARTQAVAHCFLLAGAVGAAWAVTTELGGSGGAPPRWTAPLGGPADLAPVTRILLLLVAGVGLPALVLSATSPLLNAWYGRLAPNADRGGIYRLYAVSNAGSLAALLGYPFVVEPLMTRRAQVVAWSAGLAVFAGLCGYCAWSAARAAVARDGAGEAMAASDGAAAGVSADRPTAWRRLLWLALPACASVLLLATTNTLTQDVAAVPFLWVLPLALYLLTFILAFAADGVRPYRRGVVGPMLALAAGGVCWILYEDYDAGMPVRVGVLAGMLFVCCMVCHGELAALRPHARHLTGYYLHIAAGGALGGALVAVAAPLLLARFIELHFGLWACCALALVVRWARAGEGGEASRAFGAADRAPDAPPSPVATFLSVAGLVVLGFTLWAVATWPSPGTVTLHQSRDFYGVLTVYATKSDDPELAKRTLLHGSIIHGEQFTHPQRRRIPTTYYGPASGVTLALQAIAGTHAEASAPAVSGATSVPGAETAPAEAPVSRGRRVGVVGLGTGTIAAHGLPGDVFRFYELSDSVADVARRHFTYLADSEARCEIVAGDARLSLEREAETGSQRFNLLVLDAFSGDAIPVHLLTAEAFDVYRHHMAPGGVVAVHVSNHHLDLEPVLAGHAWHLGWAAVVAQSFGGDERDGTLPADWVLLAAEDAHLERIRVARARPPRVVPGLRLWTDEYASLLKVIK